MQTVKELHIAVRQSLQKVASNQNRNFLPEEIDWALNVNQERYVKSRIKRTETGTGFALDQKMLDDISDLIVPNYSARVVKVNDTTGYIPLPPNYYQLIRDYSKIYTNCNPGYSEVEDASEYIGYVKFPNSTKTSNFYSDFKITLNYTNIIPKINVLFDNTEYDKVYLSPYEKFYLINLVLENVNSYEFNNEIPVKIFWERYKLTYRPDSFIIVSSIPFDGELKVDSSKTNTFTAVKSDFQLFKQKSDRSIPNILSVNSNLSELLADSFAKPNLDFARTYIAMDNLYGIFDSTFIISELVIDYIRKPRQISLSLNRMCELNEQTHQEIVENTVEYLMLVTENPIYSTKQQDNNLNLE
jgi:hypothetical protein